MANVFIVVSISQGFPVRGGPFGSTDRLNRQRGVMKEDHFFKRGDALDFVEC